jgi:hypothetical protein
MNDVRHAFFLGKRALAGLWARRGRIAIGWSRLGQIWPEGHQGSGLEGAICVGRPLFDCLLQEFDLRDRSFWHIFTEVDAELASLLPMARGAAVLPEGGWHL